MNYSIFPIHHRNPESIRPVQDIITLPYFPSLKRDISLKRGEKYVFTRFRRMYSKNYSILYSQCNYRVYFIQTFDLTRNDFAKRLSQHNVLRLKII